MSSSSIGFRRSTCALTVFAAITLTACSENATSPSKAIAPGSAAFDQSPDVIDATGRHLFRTKTWFANNPSDNARPGGGGGGTNTGIYFHGGPVLQSGTNVVAIYWAAPADQPIYTGAPTSGFNTTSGSGDGSLVGYFLSNLGGSSYFNIN